MPERNIPGRKIIEKWVHIPGVHCGSVTLRDVVTYNGYPWSEPMCFGIGGGLGFYYTKSEDLSPTRMIFMRGSDMEPSFLSLADKPTSWRHGNKDTMIDIIKSWIDKNVPVVIQTDIYYLDYYESSTHFPGHVVSVWGYDDREEKMFVADNHFEGLKEVGYGEFLEGMGSSERSNPLDYNYMEVNPGKLRGLTELIPEAIRENARKMLEGVSGGRGKSGVGLIKSWAEDLPYWNEARDWKWCARFGYQVIKKRGVGGAGFRWIYRDFLREAEGMVPLLNSLNLSGEMDPIGGKWSVIGDLLKDISTKDSPDTDLLLKASERALEVWEMEREFYKKALREIG